MILEAIVTTLDGSGRLNVAPMGPEIEPGARRFTLRPYNTSTTYRNLKASGEGVLHVTDDVLLLARAAIGRLDVDALATTPATAVRGRILLNACRYQEFRVTSLDDNTGRTTIEAVTVAEGNLRDFFGFNRAKHAVVEAAILATRLDFLPLGEIRADYRKLEVLVRKTGGPAEREAFDLLAGYFEEAASKRGPRTEGGDSEP
jgi:hypothetical protein